MTEITARFLLMKGRITKGAAKTSSSKEQIIYIIKKGPRMILELL